MFSSKLAVLVSDSVHDNFEGYAAELSKKAVTAFFDFLS